MPNYIYNRLTLFGKALDLIQFYEDNKTDIYLLSFKKCVYIDEDSISSINFEDQYKIYMENWGTMWDAFDVESAVISFSMRDKIDRNALYNIEYIFYTAWSPPEVWLQKISEKYTRLTGELIYESEDILFFGKYNLGKGNSSKIYEYTNKQIMEYVKQKIKPIDIIKYFNERNNNNLEINIYTKFIQDFNLWERHYNEDILEDVIKSYIEFYDKNIVQIQNAWRKMLSKRKISKKIIERELIFLPPRKNFSGGIEYQNAFNRFYNN